MKKNAHKERLIDQYIQENLDAYKKASKDVDYCDDSGIEAQIASRFIRRHKFTVKKDPRLEN